ncbi:hypothetical protein JOD65_001840 [Nocardioides cavernae]|nr:hypothetical protein [Nocardioides cavernae]
MRQVIHLGELVKAAGRCLRQWGVWVWERVTGEPGYIDALADLTLAAANLLVSGNRARRTMAAATHVVVAIVRTIWRRNEEGDPQHLWA